MFLGPTERQHRRNGNHGRRRRQGKEDKPDAQKQSSRRISAAVLAGGGAGAAVYALAAGGSTKVVVDHVTSAAPVANVSSSALSVGDIYKASSKGVVEVDSALSGSGSSTFPGGGGVVATSAEGTGFVYDDQGHIVTNEHVIDGATSVKVSFGDGKTYTRRSSARTRRPMSPS